MQRVSQAKQHNNNFPVGQERANSQGLAILVSARPPTGNFYFEVSNGIYPY